MSAPEIAQIIDLDRYPLDRPESVAVEQLIDQGRTALERHAIFCLKGFVRKGLIAALAKELEDLVPQAVRYHKPRIAYDYDGTVWPKDHPRSQVHPCRYYQVLNYQIANDSPLRQIFQWQPLTDFLRLLMGYETFFRSECPHLALTAKIAGEGDTDGWHYDSNDVVFSLLLQAPEGGGEFECAPYIRSESDENYDGVMAVIGDPANHALKPDITPGDLTVFKGDLTLHRVTPVMGNRRRVVALFCYDQRPGMTFSQAYIDELQSYLT